MNDAELVDSLARVEALAHEWDALAVSAANPVAAPAWVLAWLRHVAAEVTLPRIVAVRDRGELIGVAPFYAVSRRGLVEYRLMSSDYGVCLVPLALPGREWDVAAAVAAVLDSCRPRPDLIALGPMSLASHWTRALSACWPGPVPALAHQYDVMGAPVVLLRGRCFEDWFASLAPKMRGNLRRTERQFQQAGGTSRWSTAETLRADAEAFARLHSARWGARGRSRLAALGTRLPDWVEELGRELIGEGRFRMGVLELDGAPICVDLNLLAGGELAAINVGWDERYARLAPPRIAAVRLVEGAYKWGCRRVHLGRGAMQNKLRLANGNDPVAEIIVMPPSVRLARTYARVLPMLARDHAREIAERTLPAPWLGALRSLRRRIRSRGARRGRSAIEAGIARAPRGKAPEAAGARRAARPSERLAFTGRATRARRSSGLRSSRALRQ